MSSTYSIWYQVNFQLSLWNYKRDCIKGRVHEVPNPFSLEGQIWDIMWSKANTDCIVKMQIVTRIPSSFNGQTSCIVWLCLLFSDYKNKYRIRDPTYYKSFFSSQRNIWLANFGPRTPLWEALLYSIYFFFYINVSFAFWTGAMYVVEFKLKWRWCFYSKRAPWITYSFCGSIMSNLRFKTSDKFFFLFVSHFQTQFYQPALSIRIAHEVSLFWCDIWPFTSEGLWR